VISEGAWDAVKLEVVEACRQLVAKGLVAGANGNVSCRCDQAVVITPSRIPYSRLEPQDVVVIDFEADLLEGELPPSSETLAHLAIYRARPDVGAVIHTHSVFASALAVAGLEIPPIVDEQVVALGGGVPVAAYAPAGSQELAEAAGEALGKGNAVLLRNHGAIAAGRDLAEAVAHAELVERLAQIYIMARLLGRAEPLPPSIVAMEQALFRMQREVSP